MENGQTLDMSPTTPDDDFYNAEERTQVDRLLQVNELDITGEMTTCAGHYEYYAQLATDAQHLLRQTILKREQYEARLVDRLRQDALTRYEMNGTYPKRPLLPQKIYEGYGLEKESDLKRMFMKDEGWLACRHVELTAEYNYDVLHRFAKGFEIKAHMLQSINKKQTNSPERGVS